MEVFQSSPCHTYNKILLSNDTPTCTCLNHKASVALWSKTQLKPLSYTFELLFILSSFFFKCIFTLNLRVSFPLGALKKKKQPHKPHGTPPSRAAALAQTTSPSAVCCVAPCQSTMSDRHSGAREDGGGSGFRPLTCTACYWRQTGVLGGDASEPTQTIGESCPSFSRHSGVSDTLTTGEVL